MLKLAEKLADTIRAFHNKEVGQVPSFTPTFTSKDEAAVLGAVSSGWVSTAGTITSTFEESLSAILNQQTVVATNTGTAALHILLKSIGVGPDDEVLVPAFTFIASANAVLYCGATPNFVDISLDSLAVCPIKLRNYLGSITELTSEGVLQNKNTGKRIKALIAVYPYGYCPALDELNNVCREFKIALIEDAAAALGSTYKGKPPGSWGAGAALSFNGNKILTTGGGGAVVSSNRKVIDKAYYLANVAKLEGYHNHGDLGFNYRMPALNASLGNSQLSKLPEKIEWNFHYYNQIKKVVDNTDYSGFELLEGSRPNFWVPIIKAKDIQARTALLRQLHAMEISAYPSWKPVCENLYLRNMPADNLQNTLMASETLVVLPAAPAQ
jgi:perosamine synthetase